MTDQTGLDGWMYGVVDRRPAFWVDKAELFSFFFFYFSFFLRHPTRLSGRNFGFDGLLNFDFHPKKGNG